MTTREPDQSPTPPRDAAFDALWRAASSEAPPPALDAAILAAAHRAVDAGPRRVLEATRPERWWWPLAAAATIGAITVGILQVMPDRPDALDGEAAIVSDMPAAKRDAGAPAATPSAAPPGGARPAPTAERQAKPRVEPRVPAPATDDAGPAAPERRAAESANAFPAAAPPPTTAGKLAAGSAMEAAPSTLAQQRAPLPVADWIALIRRLRAEGRDDEAARELAAFRRAHPDHPRLLPEDLRDWPPAAK